MKRKYGSLPPAYKRSRVSNATVFGTSRNPVPVLPPGLTRRLEAALFNQRVYGTPRSSPIGPAGRTRSRRTGGRNLFRNSRRRAIYHGRAAGFLRSRRRRGRATPIQRYGYGISSEQGAVLTDNRCCIIMHSTTPRDTMVKLLFGALTKFVLTKLGIVQVSPTAALPFLAATDQITVVMRPQAGGSLSVFTYTIPAGTATFANVSDGLYNAFELWFSAAGTAAPSQCRIVSVTFTPVASLLAPFQVNMFDAKISYKVKSTLKLQNRSLSSSGEDDGDDVDNTPLYGKSYFGYGTFTEFNAAQYSGGLGDFCTNGNGIYADVAANVNGYVEPPRPVDFTNVKKSGKIKLQPGEIKTSVLTTSKTQKLSDFCAAFLLPDNIREIIKQA